MGEKSYGTESNKSKKRRHKIIKCKCGYRNDYDEMLENNDVDSVGNTRYIYCLSCGEQIQVK